MCIFAAKINSEEKRRAEGNNKSNLKNEKCDETKLPDESRARNKPLVRLQSLYVVERSGENNFALTGMLRMRTAVPMIARVERTLSLVSTSPPPSLQLAKSECTATSRRWNGH